MNPFKAAKVEDYATTLLAGSAASYIHVQDKRCRLKRSFGEAGLEMKFLRQLSQSVQREPDRAIAIIRGSLGVQSDRFNVGAKRTFLGRQPQTFMSTNTWNYLMIEPTDFSAARRTSQSTHSRPITACR
jgi:hypothetical protein